MDRTTLTSGNNIHLLLTYVEACICIHHTALSGLHDNNDKWNQSLDSIDDWTYSGSGTITDDVINISSSAELTRQIQIDHRNEIYQICPLDRPEIDHSSSMSKKIEDFLYTRIAVAVCLVGLVGNAASVAVLATTQRRPSQAYRRGSRHRLQMISGSRRWSSSSTGTVTAARRTAPTGRIQRFAGLAMAALATSDALFCLSVLPLGFVERDPLQTTVNLSAVYSVYGETIINVFVVSSTWLTVAMAIGRFAAAVRPLHARAVIGRRMALRCIIFVFIACAALNVPRTFWNDLRSVTCRSEDVDGVDFSTPKATTSSATYYFRWHGYLHAYNRPLLERAYFWFYSVVAILLPLGLLVIVSAWLIIHLRGRGRYGGQANSGGMRHQTVVNLGYRQNIESAPIEAVQLNDLSSQEPTPGSAGLRGDCGEETSTVFVFRSNADAGCRATYNARHERRSRTTSTSSTSSSSSSYISTLVAVAAAHVFLVCPAELLTFARQRLPLTDWRGPQDDITAITPSLGGVNYNFLAAVLNTIQTTNFAFNFALYCIVNAPFRWLFVGAIIRWASSLRDNSISTLRTIFCCNCRDRNRWRLSAPRIRRGSRSRCLSGVG